MQANERDSVSLWDMKRAIRRIQEFTADVSCETYLESVFIQSAVERQLGILGEAAGESFDRVSAVPSRNRLAKCD